LSLNQRSSLTDSGRFWWAFVRSSGC